MKGHLGIVGCLEFPDLDDDLPLLSQALGKQGFTSEFVAWDDPAVAWSAFTGLVIRGTWDSTPRPGDYLAWADQAARASILMNPPDVLRWNLNKMYLSDLRDAGIPIVPTQWVRPGDSWEPPIKEFVVKPSISGGAIEAARYRPADVDQARSHIQRLHLMGQTVMVQQYYSSVDSLGEVSLIFFGGAFSHAVRKHGLLKLGTGAVSRLWELEVFESAEPSPDEVTAAAATVDVIRDRFGEHLVYSRVDLVRGDDGGAHVLEAELIDPSLFLTFAPGAADKLAAEIGRRVATVGLPSKSGD